MSEIIEVLEIVEHAQIENLEIIDRAKQSTKNGWTKHFIVKDATKEVGFLSLDLMYHRKLLFLYELFVVTDKRRNGIGQKILDWVYEFARKEKFETIWLEPNPFDRSVTLEVLNKFYMTNGFNPQPESSQLMKEVSVS